MKHSRVPLVTTVAVLVFLYMPVAVLVAHSFNASRFSGAWEGFTADWYSRLLPRREVWTPLPNTPLFPPRSTRSPWPSTRCAAAVAEAVESAGGGAARLLLEGAMADTATSIADAQDVMRLLKAVSSGALELTQLLSPR